MKAKAAAAADLERFLAGKAKAPCVVCSSPDVDVVNEYRKKGAKMTHLREWLKTRGLDVKESQMDRHFQQGHHEAKV